MLSNSRLTLTLLLVVAGLAGLFIGLNMSSDDASAQLVAGGERYMVAVNSYFLDNEEPVFIVDTRKQVVAVYEYDSETDSLMLGAVRSYEWDRKLRDYNNERPTPTDIRRGAR